MPGTARISSSCSTACALLDHQDDHDLLEGGDVFGRGGLVPVAHPPVGRAIQAAAGRGVGPDGPHAGARVVGGPHVREQDGLESGAHGSLRQPRPRLLVELDHRAEPVELRRPAEVVEPMQVVRRVLARELDVVVLPGVADDLDDGRPRRVDVRADRRATGSQQLPKTVRTHGPTATGGRSRPTRRNARRPRARTSSVPPGAR